MKKKNRIDELMLYPILIFFLVFILTMPRASSEAQLRSKVVKLMGDTSMCSGEQVRAPSGEDYILTASHCIMLAKNGSIEVHTEDGRIMQRKVIAEDMASDLLLLEGIPNTKGLDIAKSNKSGQHVRTFTHGHNMDTYKTEGDLMQNVRVKFLMDTPLDKCVGAKYEPYIIGPIAVCLLSVDETTTSAYVVPGSSGGMVVDDAGRLTGVVSAGDTVFGYLVMLKDINAFLKNY